MCVCVCSVLPMSLFSHLDFPVPYILFPVPFLRSPCWVSSIWFPSELAVTRNSDISGILTKRQRFQWCALKMLLTHKSDLNLSTEPSPFQNLAVTLISSPVILKKCRSVIFNVVLFSLNVRDQSDNVMLLQNVGRK